MSGEDDDPDWLILTPDQIRFTLAEDAEVLMRLDLGPSGQFLEHPVAIRMTSSQARQIAAELVAKADEAETQSPPSTSGGS